MVARCGLVVKHISIHAPREGRDAHRIAVQEQYAPFQSTRPARGATTGVFAYMAVTGFQSTRPARGATTTRSSLFAVYEFQSTRPARGATVTTDVNATYICIFQSTRPARGATASLRPAVVPHEISIHAPREGRDSKSEQISSHIFAKKAWIPDIFAQNAAFQSVLPLADRQKLLYLRCEPLRKFLRACASHYKIIGSSGRYVCLQPKCSILFSYFLPK